MFQLFFISLYIGQTINEKDRRKHFLIQKLSYGGIKIDTARAKYNPENFKYEILETRFYMTKKAAAKELLQRQLSVVKKLKNKIVQETDNEMAIFNKFREFSKDNPSLTYEEFCKQWRNT